MLGVLGASVLGAVVGGLGFRIRGAREFQTVTGRGATTARIVAWSLPLATMWAVWGPAAPGWWVIMVVALWLGSIAGWWGDLRLVEARDVALHAARGVLWVLPAAVLVALKVELAPALALLVAGALCAPAYLLGWRLGGRLELGGTEWGELIFGAVVGAVLVGGSAIYG